MAPSGSSMLEQAVLPSWITWAALAPEWISSAISRVAPRDRPRAGKGRLQGGPGNTRARKAHAHLNCFFKTKAIKVCESSTQKSPLRACAMPRSFPDAFTDSGGCLHPSGERIICFHRQLGITCKCHLAERFLHASKDILKLLTTQPNPLFQ